MSGAASRDGAWPAGLSGPYPRPIGQHAYEVDVDKSRLQLDVIHGFLSQSYWARGATLTRVARSIAGADCFAVYLREAQVAFGRVITDRTTIAWLSDVFVLPEHRGRGLGKSLIAAMLGEPAYHDVRAWMLSTKDAHGLYRRFGFEPADTTTAMVLRRASAGPASDVDQHGDPRR